MSWKVLVTLLVAAFLAGCAVKPLVPGLDSDSIFKGIVFPEDARLYIRNDSFEGQIQELTLCGAAWRQNDPRALPPSDYANQFQGQFSYIVKEMVASGNWVLVAPLEAGLGTSFWSDDFGNWYQLQSAGELKESYSNIYIRVPRSSTCSATPGKGEIEYEILFAHPPEVPLPADRSVVQGWESLSTPGPIDSFVFGYVPPPAKREFVQTTSTGDGLYYGMQFCALAWGLGDPLWPEALPSAEEYSQKSLGQFNYVLEPMLADKRWQLVGPPPALEGETGWFYGTMNWYEFEPVDSELASRFSRVVITVPSISACTGTPGIGEITYEFHFAVPYWEFVSF